MLSGVPNLALALGYTNASWTLKCDLVAEYVCRLLNHMDEHDYRRCMPLAPGPGIGTEPIIDLTAGYVLRSIDQLPEQGTRTPWRLHQNYPLDILMLRHGRLDDEGIEFSGAERETRAEAVAA
jgi:monooxygenase